MQIPTADLLLPFRHVPREGNGTPLQYSCLENPRDGGAWWAAIYGVAQSRPRLKRLSSSSSRCVPQALSPFHCVLSKERVHGTNSGGIHQTHRKPQACLPGSPNWVPRGQSCETWLYKSKAGSTQGLPLNGVENCGSVGTTPHPQPLSSLSPAQLPVIRRPSFHSSESGHYANLLGSFGSQHSSCTLNQLNQYFQGWAQASADIKASQMTLIHRGNLEHSLSPSPAWHLHPWPSGLLHHFNLRFQLRPSATNYPTVVQ